MSTDLTARCSIYDRKEKPELCNKYPEVDSWRPSVCTYAFDDKGNRHGSCSCGIGACCNTPREGGMPGGAAIPAEAGGLPCKYLVWESKEKTASSESSRQNRNDVIMAAIGQD